MMSFSQSVQMCFRKYGVFSGRASRSEFWWWILFSYGVPIIMGFTGLVIELVFIVLGVEVEISWESWEAIGSLFWFVTIVPTLAVGVRRLHDSDRSGWWIAVPLVNWIMMLFRGTQGGNRFGPDPLV